MWTNTFSNIICSAYYVNKMYERIWENLRDFSSFSQGHLITIVDASGRSRRSTANQAILRPGEIAVVFCLPIIGAPTQRLRDINLGPNQFARIFCDYTTLDVFCERRTGGRPADTRMLLPGQFVVITCSR